MSMTQLTVVQYIGVMSAYGFMCIALPAFLLYPIVKKYSFASRIIIYVITGNFYMMTVVFALELLHISNSITLWLTTLLVSIFVFCITRKTGPSDILDKIIGDMQRYALGIYGRKYLRHSIQKILWNALTGLFSWVRSMILRNLLEWAVILVLFAVLIWQYWGNSLQNFGYNYSDMIVHNYWINELSENNLYAAGIYPMGYHTVIYFFHEMLGFKTMTLLRLLGSIQLLYTIIIMYAILRQLCKTKYVPAIGCFVFFGVNVWSDYCVERFLSSLPQEYGFVFMMASMYYLIQFFRYRSLDLHRVEAGNVKLKGKERRAARRDKKTADRIAGKARREEMRLAKREYRRRTKLLERMKDRFTAIVEAFHGYLTSRTTADYCLIFFAMAFSMTLSVHFYVTIVAALGCIAIALANIGRVFRKQYFFPLLRWGILSLLIAILPMAIAFAAGKPLQGSIGWGMSVMQGEQTEFDKEAEQKRINAMTMEEYFEYVYGEDYLPYYQDYLVSNEGYSAAEIAEINKKTSEEEAARAERIAGMNRVQRGIYDTGQKLAAFGGKIKAFAKEVRFIASVYMINNEWSEQYGANLPVNIFFAVLLLGVVMSFLVRLRDVEYGRNVFALVVGACLVISIFGFSKLGLPQLMDANRTRMFAVCLVGLAVGIIADSVIYFFLGFKKKGFRLATQIISLLVVLGFFAGIYQNRWYRTPLSVDALETNGAVSCLYSIIDSQDNSTWTIVSCNDEMQMGRDYGFHTEALTMLQNMENVKNESNYIPTRKVYVFVEKIPINYDGTYEGSGQKVSQEGAKKGLQKDASFGVAYTTEGRWIVMSHLYYWMQKFYEMYPNETEIYYEDDEFICYCINQNINNTFNLTIDYGYNDFILEDDLEEVRLND